jgi:iron complex transport system substrate-binding protein
MMGLARRFVGHTVLGSVAVLASLITVAHARVIVDSAGRSVEVPDHIERIQAAGPPATVLLYTLAPQELIGWVRKPRDAELPFLSPIVRNLPEIGRLTGRGDTANLEVVMRRLRIACKARPASHICSSMDASPIRWRR